MSPLPIEELEVRAGGHGADHRFFGKYRGLVVNNQDPLQVGRLQAAHGGNQTLGDLIGRRRAGT